MSNIWFIGDIHAGHLNQTRWRTGFQSEDEIFNIVKQNYNDLLRKKDTCYFLGDIAFNRMRLWDIAGWKGKKILIAGNHDTEKIPMRDFCLAFDEVHALLKYKKFWLSHAPIHPDELRGKINVHGHTHNHCIDDPRYVNVSLEQINYRPISLHEIRRELSFKGIVV